MDPNDFPFPRLFEALKLQGKIASHLKSFQQEVPSSFHCSYVLYVIQNNSIKSLNKAINGQVNEKQGVSLTRQNSTGPPPGK